MKNKIIFWILFILSLSFVPLTIVPITNFVQTLSYTTSTILLLQRVVGLLAFILLFWQIVMGAYMTKFTDKLGGWIFNYHVFQGIATYVLVFLHPLLFLFFKYLAGPSFDPIDVFFGFCLFCKTEIDLYYTLGKLSFWMLTVAVLAGRLRSINSYMRLNWRKFHILNYIAFILIGVHGFLVGSDFSLTPFVFFAGASTLIVFYIVVRKIPNLINLYKRWLNG